MRESGTHPTALVTGTPIHSKALPLTPKAGKLSWNKDGLVCVEMYLGV